MSPYKRRVYYRGAKKHYSVEQTGGRIYTTVPGGDAALVVVGDTETQGKRKVKHLTINMAHYSTASSSTGIVHWALVYQPEGTSVSTLNMSTSSPGTSLYEPSQYVMEAGVFDFDAGPCRVHCRTSRILNSGDRIVLVLKSGDTSQTAVYQYVVRYAVCYD